MNPKPINVLLIEDNVDDACLIERMLKQVRPTSFNLAVVDRLTAGRAYLAENDADVILLDLSLPDGQGLGTLADAQTIAPAVAIVVLTGWADYELGLEAVNAGAQDCLVKGRVDADLLSRSISYAVERKQSERRLRESERKFRSVIEQSVDGIVLIDEEGLIVVWNAAQVQITGLALADVIGRPAWDVLYELIPDHRKTPTQYEKLKQALVGLTQTGEVPPLIREIQRPDGERRVIQTSVFAIQTQKGFMGSSIIRDVTEQVRLQDALEESGRALAEERNLLRTVIDHLPDRVYAKDRAGCYLIKNIADTRLMGAATPEEVIGKTDFDYYPPELAERYHADDQMVIQFGQHLINREEPAMAADGSHYWILTTKVPLRNEINEIVGLVGIGRDITERRRTQEQISKLHDQINALYIAGKELGQTLNLETIFSTLQSAIVKHMACDGLYISSFTPEDRLIRCMWAWGDGQQLDTSQFPPVPLAEEGKGSQSLVIRTGEALYLPDYQAHLQDSQTVYVVREDGSVVSKDVAPEEENLPQSVLFVPMKLENQVLGVIQVFSYQLDAYSEDDLRFLKALAPQVAAAVANALLFQQTQHEVFERERAEAELRELNESLEQRIAARAAELRASEARYRAIIEDQTELICRSLPDMTVVFANEAYCRFYGVSLEDIIHRQFLPLVFEDDRARWAEQYAAMSPLNPVVIAEHRVVGGDGKIHWLQWTNRLIMDSASRPVEVQAVGRDITRQKQAEDVLRQALTHEMDVNDMRSRFISMASHDLRTPLAVIQASSDLLSLYADRLSEERKRDVYHEIDQAIRHMVTLLDNILLLGRADAGKVAVEPEPIDLKTFCQNLLTELKTAFGTAHHLTLAVTGECERMWLDPRLVRHIIGNLVSNAIKFSPSGSDVQLDLKCTADQVVLSVEDQGIGILIDEQKRLFETFFRGSNVGRTPGTGLGLAIVRQSVEMHGGSITFESRPGEGTTFFVVLPCIPLEEKFDETAPDR